MKMCSFQDLESFFKASFAVVAVKIVYSTKLSAFREADWPPLSLTHLREGALSQLSSRSCSQSLLTAA